ncbi:MAG TPA: glycosyltransferase family 39 protein [Acidimicrobiales bacterium]|nr:glycosyltransferase family 39 protein [Acidimicrobiales bacterium]
MALALDAPPAPPPARSALRTVRSALVPVVAVAVAKLAFQLSVAGRYGWHRDELYYVDAGRHLSLGYVDFPPVTPLLSRVATALFGDSLVGLRSLAALAGAVAVVVVALLARELGGGRAAQVLAAILAATSPALLGADALFQTVPFDQLAWAVIALLAVRALRDGSRGRWLALGVAAGVALETKYTVAALLLGLAVGLVVTASGRRHLRTSGPWMAAAVALLLLAPNLWWQTRHGWPSVDFFTGGEGYEPGESSPGQYAGELLLMVGPAALVLCGAGLRLLGRDRRWSPLAVAAVVVVAGFVATGGKSYYAAPVALLLYAAGAVAAAGWGWGRWAVVGGAVVTIAVAGAYMLPLAGERSMVDRELYEQRDDYAEQLGWPELAAEVTAAARDMTPEERASAAVLAGNYGEAGALGRFGGGDLPPVVSAHVSWRYWVDDDALTARTLVVVGYARSWLEPRCASLDRVGTVTNDAGVPNEEAGGPVFRCRLPGTLADVWPDVLAAR